MNESTARNIRVQDRYDELMRIGRHGHYETMFQVVREEIESLRQQLSAAQAKIDELMLEYCPEEMTNEQIAEYEKHQRPAWRNFSLELKKEQK